MSCPIYGCNRTEKPFPRVDKFREHCGKHKNPDKFLCFIETCHIGPLSRLQLREHLMDPHAHESFIERDVYRYCEALPSLGSEYRICHVRRSRLEGTDRCPVRTVDCTFQLSYDHPYMEDHLDTHDLVDRIKYCETIQKLYMEYNYAKGPATCPTCRQKSYASDLLSHLRYDHSREERSHSALEFCRAVASLYPLKYNHDLIEIMSELRCSLKVD
jgi:hypothetical protein